MLNNMVRTWKAFFVLLFIISSVQISDAQQKNATSTKVSSPKLLEKTKIIYSDPITGMKFEFVKGGCFKMGDFAGDGEKDEQPVHDVCVSDYYIGKYEVTQNEWTKVTGVNAASDQKCGLDCPVEAVSWVMVQEFITTLNNKSGKQYRLPTEAEWEYAARNGGKNEKWSGTNNAFDLEKYALYGSALKAVGTKQANGLGLHDMSGNIMEWCQDWYAEDYYKISPKNNPTGPDSGVRRVLRGGLANHAAKDLRTTARNNDDPAVSDGSNGFRLVLPAK